MMIMISIESKMMMVVNKRLTDKKTIDGFTHKMTSPMTISMTI